MGRYIFIFWQFNLFMLKLIYSSLLGYYGHQGWWPFYSLKARQGFDTKGYHKGQYSIQGYEFEVIVGAILTQNTSWKNVEKALENLFVNDCLTPSSIMNCNNLTNLVRPSGYYNQKAERLKTVAKWYLKNKLFISKMSMNQLRNRLLELKGIGPETADSILLYAFQRPSFVVDAYTLRLLDRLGYKDLDYNSAQSLVHHNFKNVKNVSKMFNELHALIVEHCKVYCTNKPLCKGCPLLKQCKYVGVEL